MPWPAFDRRGGDKLRPYECEDIALHFQGNKGGRSVGPDVRLEPSPALEWLSAAEQERIKSDPANVPGTMRKVGPSLRRLSEKVGDEWTRKWISDPRGFREDTRMPHFYGVSNNNEEALKGTGQEKFPDAEIQSITYNQWLPALLGNNALPKYQGYDPTVNPDIADRARIRAGSAPDQPSHADAADHGGRETR